MRALTLVGNGAKHIWWFAFGPEPVFPGNCYSGYAIGQEPSYPGIGQNTTHSALFAAMAEASRMIAGADDMLYEGEMPYSQVAILYPRSSWMWDVVNGSDHDGVSSSCASHCVATRSSAPPCSVEAPVDSTRHLISQTHKPPTDHDINEDQGETEMDYQSAVYGIFRALAQYSNRQVDFIDEDALTQDAKYGGSLNKIQ